MKKVVFLIIFQVCLFSCEKKNKSILKEGKWLVELAVMDNEKLPFNLNLTKDQRGNYVAQVYNADETITIDEILVSGDSIIIKMPVFESCFKGTFNASTIKGEFINENLDRVVPFVATYGISNRFSSNLKANKLISGIWETHFSPETSEEYSGKGSFVQNGDKVTGTFRTTTGDYRYLEGAVFGDSLKLSAFDGAHAFLFVAKISDSALNGMFYSGNHFKEPFVAKRNEVFELPDEDSLTYINEGYNKIGFSFPVEVGKIISLTDERFSNKPTVIQIMGTWCPNCLDETKFLVDFKNQNKQLNFEIVALAFEYAKTEEAAFKSIQRLKDRVGVNYPILLAQYGDADKQLAQEKLPMLNHILSYPTTIFLDNKGQVRKIKTGFNGPATGAKYIAFKKEFNDFVNELALEK